MPSAFLTGLLAIVLALQPAFAAAQGASSTGFSATSSGAGFGIDLGSGLPVACGSHATGEGEGTVCGGTFGSGGP
ncbi:hypothetical protein [Ciceribacter sp. RN22]|uniref:hypothetical protein n=1 Tax=Ciceribacter sp. RN22 TaxID=2954932 RepID=UPI00209248FE|nr:hypothetical protein [Ciceribacter sp. RN22]MCO6180895.1 hypothetical protein [Ciceribacter sp. RN22]